MLVLCLDTATADVAAAVVDLDDPARAAVCHVRDARGAGEHLMPLALDALARAGAELADLGALAVGLGPGPFTGLRAGVVTGAVLARTRGIPAYGACSLDVIAAERVAAAAGCGPFVVATDARRREVYWARYDDAGIRREGPAVARPADLAARVGAPPPVVGPATALYGDLLPPAAGVDPGAVFPVARLADLVADRVRSRAPGEVLVPLYLRRPDVDPAAATAGARS